VKGNDGNRLDGYAYRRTGTLRIDQDGSRSTAAATAARIASVCSGVPTPAPERQVAQTMSLSLLGTHLIPVQTAHQPIRTHMLTAPVRRTQVTPRPPADALRTPGSDRTASVVGSLRNASKSDLV
jgi:hypothetical protein